MESRLSRRPGLGGVVAALPLVPGIASVGVLYGAAAVDAGMPSWTVVATSLLVATGTAQWVALDLLMHDTAWWLVIVIGLLINIRFAVYSFHVGGWLSDWPGWRRLAYCGLLTDEGYALSMSRASSAASVDRPTFLRWSLALTSIVWLAWLLGTAVGALTGAVVPPGLGLDRAVPLTLLCVLVLLASTSRHLLVAVVAGVVAVLLRDVPFGLGLLAAIGVGVAVGMAGRRRDDVPVVDAVAGAGP